MLRELNFDEKRFAPKAVLAHISKQKNNLVTPQEYRAASYFEEIAGRVYRGYQQALQANNAMDFDDLLMRTVLLLRDNLDVRVKYQQKWRLCAGGRVSGHQHGAIRVDPPACHRADEQPQRLCRGRRGPVDLQVSRG